MGTGQWNRLQVSEQSQQFFCSAWIMGNTFKRSFLHFTERARKCAFLGNIWTLVNCVFWLMEISNNHMHLKLLEKHVNDPDDLKLWNLIIITVSVIVFFCSLALVLPKYSEHFIQAKLGNEMKQAMCEYSICPHDKECTNKSSRLCWCRTTSSLEYFLFVVILSISTCFVLFAPSWNRNHSFVFSAQISRSPQRFSFVVQPTGQSPCTPTHTHPHAFPLPDPAKSTGSFDLVYILLFWTYLLPLSGTPSCLGGDETSLTSTHYRLLYQTSFLLLSTVFNTLTGHFIWYNLMQSSTADLPWILLLRGYNFLYSSICLLLNVHHTGVHHCFGHPIYYKWEGRAAAFDCMRLYRCT